jgi:L-threonylcarbamoyladenylate synthase
MSRTFLLFRRLSSRLARTMDTRVLRCDTAAISFAEGSDVPTVADADTQDALTQAAAAIRAGACVAFPTETVYGLGADARNADAVRGIFAAKRRPADNPLIVHVASRAMLDALLPPGYTPPRAYDVLARRFWPGPLTLLYPAGAGAVPAVVTAGQRTVGVRMPAHPVARALIAASGAPLAAPSANASGRPSPTRAAHAAADLAGRVPLVLDGGPCAVGVESTVVDGLQPDGALRVLRPGGVTVEDMERALAEELPPAEVPRVLVHRRDFRDAALEHAPTTPGMKYTHYAPSAPVTLVRTTPAPVDVEAETIDAFLASMHDTDGEVGLLMSADSLLARRLLSDTRICWRIHDMGPAANPAVAAQRLFDGLLTLDGAGVTRILLEAIDEQREGLAVMNRARKAAGETQWVVLDGL